MNRGSYITFFLIVLTMSLTGCRHNKMADITINDSVLDLRDIDFTEVPQLKIQGNCKFYRSQLPFENEKYIPENLTELEFLEPSKGYWSGTYLHRENSSGAKGYGTYSLRILSPKDPSIQLSLSIPAPMTACEIWVNGNRIGKYGVVGKTEMMAKASGENILLPISDGNDVLDVLIAVSNYERLTGGGFRHGIRVGETQQLQNSRELNILWEGITSAIVILIALYNIFLYFTDRKRRFNLYFGVFCIFGMLRQLAIGEVLFTKIPGWTYTTIHTWRYLGFFMGIGFVSIYFSDIFPKEISKRITRFVLIAAILFSIYILCTPIFYSIHSEIPFEIIAITAVGYYVYGVALATIRKRNQALIMLISTLVFIVVLINDILNNQGMISTVYLQNYVFLAYVLVHVVINHGINIKSKKDIEQLSVKLKDLHQKVAYKKEEISALMLENIKQLNAKQKLTQELNEIQKTSTDNRLQSILSTLRASNLEESKLLTLKEHIDDYNFEFLAKLKELHPSLSKTQTEICSLIVIGLSRHEIAQLRSTSLEAVKITRKRIRKKVELPTEILLDDYLKGI